MIIYLKKNYGFFFGFFFQLFFPDLFFSTFFFSDLFFSQPDSFPLLFFFVTWDGQFTKKTNKRNNKKLYPIKNEENRTWDEVDNRL